MKFDEYFIKEQTGHLEKISNMDYKFFFFYHFNWSIVNINQESTHECILLTIQAAENFIVAVLFESEFE